MDDKNISSGAEKAERLEQKTAYYAQNNATAEYCNTSGAPAACRRGGHKRQRAPGFGGWLAAVIALSVATLTLGTMLAFGWMKMNDLQDDMADGTARSVYELNAAIDNLDANLSKARVAGSDGERAKIFTDIAIESELAESALERLAADGESGRALTSFINKVGESARNILYTVARDGSMTPSQKASIEYMYRYNRHVKEYVNGLTSSCRSEDIVRALNEGGALFDSFDGYVDPAIEPPKEIYDGPFAENANKPLAKAVDALNEVSAERTEQLAMEYFADYGAEGARCTGETEAEGLECRNVEIYAGGESYFAQFTKKGGKLVMFDSFKECTQKKFSVENCIEIAKKFLNKAGYTGMTAVWSSENGPTCNLNFVYEEGGVAVYPDMIKVKVCEERGIVTGIEALPYLLNHTARRLPAPAMSIGRARAQLHGMVDIATERTAVIPFDGGEKLAYEFYGTYGGETYYIYFDADSGEQLQVFTVIGTAQGKSLM